MTLNSRKGGMVARLRVSPKDCLGVLDCMQVMGMEARDHSFSGCVSLVLSSLIAFARQQEIIAKDEDGFQYLNRMEYFLDQVSTQAKRERTNNLYENAVRGIGPPMLSIPVPQTTYVSPGPKLEMWKVHPDLFEEYKKLDELFPDLDVEQKARRIELKNFLQLL